MLISATDLLAYPPAPELRLIDCRFALDNPAYGRESYLAGHIPGAQFADLETDLSAPVIKGVTGRHPLPAPDMLLACLRRWGIDEHSDLVLYDDGSGAFAARLWWLLGWLGITKVRLLDGGLKAWLAAGGALEAALPVVAPSDLQAAPHNEQVVSSAEVLANLSEPAFTLLDARALPRFRGEVEPIDPVAGHIPAALCLPFDGNLQADGCFKPPAELKARFAALADRALVCSCGSGVTACHNIFALTLAGLARPRLYAGSWSEWITDATRPVAIGDQP